ncbi:MAG: hypothetical protein EXS31_18620 [Pedosphaera sp.]|nr:hypothetical protein [Pedosphaera sp.]
MHDTTLMGAVGGSEVVAMQNGLVLRSETGLDWDAGISLATVAAGNPLGDNSSMTFGSGLFVAPLGGGISTSTDGAQWVAQPQAGCAWSRIRYSSGMFLALGEGRDGGEGCGNFAFSHDGEAWMTNDCNSPDLALALHDVATDGNIFVLAAEQRTPSEGNRYSRPLWRSKDGVTWVEGHRNDINGDLLGFGIYCPDSGMDYKSWRRRRRICFVAVLVRGRCGHLPAFAPRICICGARHHL